MYTERHELMVLFYVVSLVSDVSWNSPMFEWINLASYKAGFDVCLLWYEDYFLSEPNRG